MANQDKVLSMLGLAARARGVADGGFSVEKAIKSGKAALVILAGDASGNPAVWKLQMHKEKPPARQQKGLTK